MLLLTLLNFRAPADADDNGDSVAEEEGGMLPHVVFPGAVVVDPWSVEDNNYNCNNYDN